MKNFKIEKKIYADLLNEKLEFNSFKKDLSFNTDDLDIIELSYLNKYQISETFFYGNNDFDQSLNFFKTGLRKRLLFKSVYQFVCEHKPAGVSKLRSYKGIIDKTKIITSNVIQCETMISDKASIFTALIKLQFELLDDYFFDYFLDSSTSFVFIPDTENFDMTCDFNNKIASQYISIDGTAELNYLKLMLKYCSLGFKLYRVGGDGTGGYWSLQEFSSLPNLAPE